MKFCAKCEEFTEHHGNGRCKPCPAREKAYREFCASWPERALAHAAERAAVFTGYQLERANQERELTSHRACA